MIGIYNIFHFLDLTARKTKICYETRITLLHKSTPCFDCESDFSFTKTATKQFFDAKMTLKCIFKTFHALAMQEKQRVEYGIWREY